jgi:hypothetical protein
MPPVSHPHRPEAPSVAGRSAAQRTIIAAAATSTGITSSSCCCPANTARGCAQGALQPLQQYAPVLYQRAHRRNPGPGPCGKRMR